MKFANLDRPLDELIKESLAKKRADRNEKKKSIQEKRTFEKKNVRENSAPTNNKTDNNIKPALTPKSTNESAQQGANDKLRARPKGAVAKRRRNRNNRNRGLSKNDAGSGNDTQQDDRNASDSRGNGRVESRVGRTNNKLSQKFQNDSPSAHNTVPAPGKAVKVVVSNLHPQVTQSDIAELFETVGPLKSATLNRYPNGSSAGEAVVIFENMQDALDAIKRYNMVPLDKQPLQITLVTNRNKGRRNSREQSDGRENREAGSKKRKSGELYDSPQDSNGYDRQSPNDRQSPQDRPNGNVRRNRNGPKRRRFNNRRNDDRVGRPTDRINDRLDDRGDRNDRNDRDIRNEHDSRDERGTRDRYD